MLQIIFGLFVYLSGLLYPFYKPTDFDWTEFTENIETGPSVKSLLEVRLTFWVTEAFDLILNNSGSFAIAQSVLGLRNRFKMKIVGASYCARN